MSELKKVASFSPYETGNPAKKSLGLGLGDRIERLVKPIAVALRMPCLDKETKTLKPESPCGKRRDALNRIGEKMGMPPGTHQNAP